MLVTRKTAMVSRARLYGADSHGRQKSPFKPTLPISCICTLRYYDDKSLLN